MQYKTLSTGTSYKAVHVKDFLPELVDFIRRGQRMKRTFNIKPDHIEKALRDVRKGK